MNSGIFNILDSENEPESFYENLNSWFTVFIKQVGASCGVLVLKEEEEGAYTEYASSGFKDDFFYEFMARGKGNFELVETNFSPVLFLPDECELYNKNSRFAIVSRVALNETMLGFLLLEFSGEISEATKLLIALTANRIAQVHSSLHQIEIQSGIKKSSKPKEFIVPELYDLLVNNSEGKEIYLKNGYLLLNGPEGIGKKNYIKTIYEKASLSGEILFLNIIPEQLVKLEKYLEEWQLLSGSGILVFEKAENISLAQQRFFYEKLKSGSRGFIFIKEGKPQEEYRPFWKLFEEKEILFQSLNSLEKNKLTQIVRILFQSIITQKARLLKISEEAVSFLCEYEYKFNLSELHSILETAVLQSEGDLLTKENILNTLDSRVLSHELFDEEDLNLRKSVRSLERQKILLANKIFSGNQIRMSKALGISRGSLQYKMKQLEIEDVSK